MLKNISNLGSTLNKNEQQSINGGGNAPAEKCPAGYIWHSDPFTGSNGCVLDGNQ